MLLIFPILQEWDGAISQRLDKNCSVQMCKEEMIQQRLTAVIATKGPNQFSYQIQKEECF